MCFLSEAKNTGEIKGKTCQPDMILMFIYISPPIYDRLVFDFAGNKLASEVKPFLC
jgi:hypothetical protein